MPVVVFGAPFWPCNTHGRRKFPLDLELASALFGSFEYSLVQTLYIYSGQISFKFTSKWNVRVTRANHRQRRESEKKNCCNFQILNLNFNENVLNNFF